MNEELLRARHDIAMARIAGFEIDPRPPLIKQLEAERDAARAEVETYRLSLSYRIGYKLTRLVSIFKR
jgi:hypothetical protein